MGLFSGIKKVFKKIGDGVKKVFKKVGEFIGKVANSKLGKILMIAATVVTAGAALYGAFTGAMAGVTQGATFLDKFMMGAKGFLKGGMAGFKAGTQALGQLATGNLSGAANTLSNVGNAARTAAGGVQAAGAGVADAAAQSSAVVNPTDVAAGNMPTASQAGLSADPSAWQYTPSGTTTGTVNLAADPSASQAFLQGGSTTAGTVNVGAGAQPGLLSQGSNLGGNLTTVGNIGATEKGFLSRLGSAIGDAVMSPSGVMIAGQMMSGYAQAAAAEDERKEAEKRRKNSILNHPEMRPQDWIYQPSFDMEVA